LQIHVQCSVCAVLCTFTDFYHKKRSEVKKKSSKENYVGGMNKKEIPILSLIIALTRTAQSFSCFTHIPRASLYVCGCVYDTSDDERNAPESGIFSSSSTLRIMLDGRCLCSVFHQNSSSQDVFSTVSRLWTPHISHAGKGSPFFLKLN
jgi:hypothetical protein